jgi:hypothetical protein
MTFWSFFVADGCASIGDVLALVVSFYRAGFRHRRSCCWWLVLSCFVPSVRVGVVVRHLVVVFFVILCLGSSPMVA